MIVRFVCAAGVAVGACLVATSASATATLTCDIKDRAIEFHLQAAVGSIAASLSGLHAELELKAAGGRPVATIEFPADALRQHWIDEPDLRLWLHVDHDAANPELDLVISTRQKSEFDFVGTYRLTIEDAGKNRKISGRVVCGLG